MTRQLCRALALAGFLLTPWQINSAPPGGTQPASATAEEGPSDVAKVTVAAATVADVKGKKCLFFMLSPIGPLELDDIRAFAGILKQSPLSEFLTRFLQAPRAKYRMYEIPENDRRLLREEGFNLVTKGLGKRLPSIAIVAFAWLFQ